LSKKVLSLDAVLRDQIVRGQLAPASRLRMDELKGRFDVGYSPIREALSRLIGEGLVEFEPNRGFRVAALSREDLEDIAVARTAVEVMALRRSIERGDDTWESSIVAAMHRYRRRSEHAFDGEEDLRAWEIAHDELHFALISACGSPRLIEQQKRLQEQHLRYRRLIVVPEVSPDTHIEEHEKLVSVVLDRDVEQAVREIERHLMITVDALGRAQFWTKEEKAEKAPEFINPFGGKR